MSSTPFAIHLSAFQTLAISSVCERLLIKDIFVAAIATINDLR